MVFEVVARLPFMSRRKHSDASVFTSIQAWCKEWALLKTPPRRDAGLQFQQRLVLAGSWAKTILNACSPNSETKL